MRLDGAVVAGIGGGELDRVMLDWAAEEAAARDADLLLCHAEEVDGAQDGGPAAALLQEAQRVVRTRFPDLRVSVSVAEGPAGPALLQASRQAGMVVVGARRSDRLAGPHLGSVPTQLTEHGHCPTAVVRPPSVPDSVDVVVGVDGSAHSERTLRFAAAEARRFGGTLVAVHSYQLPPPAEYGPNAGIDEPHHRIAAEGVLDRTLEPLRSAEPDLKIQPLTVHAAAAKALQDAAAQAAVLVVGAHGSGSAHPLALGSVARSVLWHAPCTVLVVR